MVLRLKKKNSSMLMIAVFILTLVPTFFARASTVYYSIQDEPASDGVAGVVSDDRIVGAYWPNTYQGWIYIETPPDALINMIGINIGHAPEAPEETLKYSIKMRPVYDSYTELTEDPDLMNGPDPYTTVKNEFYPWTEWGNTTGWKWMTFDAPYQMYGTYDYVIKFEFVSGTPNGYNYWITYVDDAAGMPKYVAREWIDHYFKIEPRLVELKLELPTHTLTVHVQKRFRGAPIEDVVVEVYSDSTLIDSGSTDENGDVTFEVAEGAYTIFAKRRLIRNFYRTKEEVVIVSDDTTVTFYFLI